MNRCANYPKVCRSSKFCDFCEEEVVRNGKSPVSREGSRYCKCGSLASGGTRTYCTCDMCF
jgi:hypothetical protein